MYHRPLLPIRMFSTISSHIIPSREQFRVFLEAYKDDVMHRFVGAGGKRLICLPHETSYGLGIENKTNRKCLAEIVIGEVVLGDFIIFPRDTVVIKRGTKDDKSLVFISNTSDIAEHLGLPDPKLGSAEIFVSLRPQLIPIEERYSPFLRRGGGTFGIASAFGTANVRRANEFGTACYEVDGLSVVSDSVRSAGAAAVCGEDHHVRAAGGGVKKSNESVVDGSTVLGKATGQLLHMSPKFRTLGCHMFRFLLQVGDLNQNVIYNGHLDDNGSPISRRFPYTILE